MGNHETTCDICKNDPSITCNGACDVIEERLTGRNPSRDARIREERARRVGEAVLQLVADDSFDAYDLGVEVREIVDAFGGEP